MSLGASDVATKSGKMDIPFEQNTKHHLANTAFHVNQLDHNYVWTIDNVLTDEECDQLVHITEGHYGSAPITVGDNQYIMDEETRNNERIIWDDVVSAEALWNRIKQFVPAQVTDLRGVSGRHMEGWTACGLNERFRFYKYSKSQYFRPHYDGHFARKAQIVGNQTIKEQSFLTAIFYLNTVQEGGETNFYSTLTRSPRCVVKPKKGSLCLFVHSQLHEGAELPEHSTEHKYVLRSDVMYRKIFQ
mgnify:FL=1